MKKRILLIEDDLLTVEVYKTAFEAAGFKIESATTALQVLERLKQIREGKREKPSLILLDLILPDVNGNSLLKEIKDKPETKDIPVFVLSNYGNPALMEELTKQGADKYLLKVNYTLTQLVQAVKEALK